MKRAVWVVVAVAVVAALVVVRVTRLKEKESAPLVSQAPIAVHAALVTQGGIVHSRHVLGTVHGIDETEVAPQVMAQVTDVRVREGDAVARGEPIVLLDRRELADTVAQAEAELEAAREGLAAAKISRAGQRDATARDQRLVEANAISQEQWDRSRATDAASEASLAAARAKVKVVEKRLDQARTRLGYCTVTAPVSGVVARRLADPGDLAVPGRPLLEIVRQEKVRVRASLPAEDFADLTVGRPLTLTLGTVAIDASVSRVFPAMGRNHLATFEADIESPPPGLVANATVGVEVHLSSADGLTVPIEALLEGENKAWVFTVADGTVHPVAVTVVDRSTEAAVVSGSLQAGDRVVVARPARLMTLADGMKVSVAEQAG